MSIHSGHPFADPASERDLLRQFRGRLGGAVALCTTGTTGNTSERAGLTVSSLMVTGGQPGRALILLDPDSALAETLERGGPGAPVVIALLSWRHHQLADQFAGTAPAPGGVFAQAGFTDTPWGPVLVDAETWLGTRVESTIEVGWSVLVTCAVEEIRLGDDDVLSHRRGRYRPAGGGPG